ncbi:MAG: TraR/DksA family transcriptional regulator [Planctomycetota bacterium]
MPTKKPERAAEQPAPRRRKRRRFPKGGPTKAEVRKYREALIELQRGILRSSRNLADEALKESGQDFSFEHMADHGTDNFEQDVALSLLEGEHALLQETQRALAKIDGRADLPYGICEKCADEEPPEGSEHRCPTCPWIAKARLRAVPYARLCVVQQELEEQESP